MPVGLTFRLSCRRSGGSPSNFRFIASLDRKRLGTKVARKMSWIRGVFDKMVLFTLQTLDSC